MWKIWINPDTNINMLKSFMKPFSSNLMTGYRVGFGVNKGIIDSADLIKPVRDLPKQPSLF